MLRDGKPVSLIKITMYMYALSSIINNPNRNEEFLWINGVAGFTATEQLTQNMVYKHIYAHFLSDFCPGPAGGLIRGTSTSDFCPAPAIQVEPGELERSGMQ